MKKLSHILLPLLLSVTILFIGAGVDIVQCSCTDSAYYLQGEGSACLCGVEDSAPGLPEPHTSPAYLIS